MDNKEFVSQITGLLKANNKDNKIPKRLILSVGRDAAKFLISQKLLDRTILNETNLYTSIECVEFERIEAKRCPSIEFRRCDVLMRSINPLPPLVYSRLGSSIKDIVSLDGNFKFSLVDESQYRRNKKRKEQLKNQIFVYIGTDNHLYIPDREIFSVDLTLLTLDVEKAMELSACNQIEGCRNYWDNIFVCPDKLIETVKDITLQRLSVVRQLPQDNNPNGIENA